MTPALGKTSLQNVIVLHSSEGYRLHKHGLPHSARLFYIISIPLGSKHVCKIKISPRHNNLFGAKDISDCLPCLKEISFAFLRG